jgi:solute carrier family 41
MATGNMALIQCQSTVVGFLAALFAIAVNWLPEAEFHLDHALILCAASLLTACLASLLLGIVMIVVVIASHKCNINPDNVATPIAASLGDLITLTILAQISNYLYQCIDGYQWVYLLAIVLFLLTIPIWCVIAHHNEYTNEVLYSGWTPVITAMAISSVGGCILDFAVARFRGIAVFQPVINGVGGNLAAVQASRISTYLHQNYKLGQLSSSERILCLAPTATFFSKSTQILSFFFCKSLLIFFHCGR